MKCRSFHPWHCVMFKGCCPEFDKCLQAENQRLKDCLAALQAENERLKDFLAVLCKDSLEVRLEEICQRHVSRDIHASGLDLHMLQEQLEDERRFVGDLKASLQFVVCQACPRESGQGVRGY